MKKWNANTVTMEVTRRCNMQCEHCLRGKAQNKDLPKAYIDALMSQMEYIGDITFTGGEPSMVPEIIEYALESAKRYEVSVGNFYIVTNGKKATEDFAVACLKWYAYCEDNECTGVELSQDDYHETALDCGLLQGLSFFSLRRRTDYDRVIPMGKAKDWAQGRLPEREYFTLYEEEDCYNLEEGMIYLNCKGEIIGGCDWSYTLQNKHKICNVGELSLEAFEKFGASVER